MSFFGAVNIKCSRKMKFTKDEALEKLKGILTNGGKKPLRMSEQSMERQLETLMPLLADDETGLDDFIGKVKASFEVMNSNAESDNSAFVRKWKAEHPEGNDDKDGKGGKPAANEGEDNELKKLLDRVNELERRNKEVETEKTISQKRREIKRKLKDKGVESDEWCDMILSEIQIGEDTDSDAKADSLVKLYNKQQSTIPFNVGPLGASGKQGDMKTMFDDIKPIVNGGKAPEK